jgi:4-hydroxyphenylpyruvate dioxygenase
MLIPNRSVLDTFQIIGRVWGDPTSRNMKVPNADRVMAESLERMRNTPGLVEKIFYIQLSDVEHLREPLSRSHPVWKDGMPPRMQWSRNYRTFPCEEGNCLTPLTETVRTWFYDLGWRGWVSMEVFNKSMEAPGAEVPTAHAERGTKSWHRLLKELESI